MMSGHTYDFKVNEGARAKRPTAGRRKTLGSTYQPRLRVSESTAGRRKSLPARPGTPRHTTVVTP
jgi:hypothetical protein